MKSERDVECGVCQDDGWLYGPLPGKNNRVACGHCREGAEFHRYFGKLYCCGLNASDVAGWTAVNA